MGGAVAAAASVAARGAGSGGDGRRSRRAQPLAIAAVERHLLPSGHREEIAALAAVVDHPRGPLHVVVSCLDWAPELGAVRLEQTRALASLVADASRNGPLPVVLVGDFNSPPGTPEMQVLTEAMVDAWAAARSPADPGHTLSTRNPLAPREARGLIDQRIDYILARPGGPGAPVVVERALLAGEPRDGLHPSDHYAVVADLRL